jgi:[ribosomal protein S18]-alanine N-acetyltransferase
MNAQFPLGVQFADTKEIDALFRIEQKCFPGKLGYSKRYLEHLVSNPKCYCLVEKSDGVIRAFIILVCSQASLTCNIDTIDVDPDFKNKGIGLKLLKAAEMEMRRKGMRWCHLEVSEGNKVALTLYKKAGYKLKEKNRRILQIPT